MRFCSIFYLCSLRISHGSLTTCPSQEGVFPKLISTRQECSPMYFFLKRILYYMSGRMTISGTIRLTYQKRADSVGRHCERYGRSEEHTSELMSLMRMSYAVFS